MFRSYYGLSFNPFDKQNAKEKDRFLSKDISEMTSRLDYLKDTRGIGLFTARPGMGKSFALRCFAKSLNPNLYHMEYICLSTVSVMEFYRQLCSVLGVEPRGGKPGMFRAVQEQILYLYKDKKQVPERYLRHYGLSGAGDASLPSACQLHPRRVRCPA